MSENTRSAANRSSRFSSSRSSFTKRGASSSSGSSNTENVVAQDGGDTDIWRASEMGQVSAVRALLKKGASANATTMRKKTPLHYAVVGANVEIVEILVNAGADKRMQDEFGKAPLDYCKMFTEESKYGASFTPWNWN